MEEEKKVVEEQKKSKLPIIIIVLLLLIGVGIGCFFLGKKMNDKPKEETKTEEKTEENRIAYGSDKNTSGLEIVDTKTKNIKLNGIEYEVKIEVLDEKDGYHKTQNVYFNGYKFIERMDLYDEHLIYDFEEQGRDKKEFAEKIENNVNEELNNIKIIKDAKNNNEYLVFEDYREYYFSAFFVYILTPDGSILAKLCSFYPSFVYLEKEGKNIYIENYTNIKEDSIYFLPLQNIVKIPIEVLREDDDKQVFELQENKLVIEDGKPIVTKSEVYKSSDGYRLLGAGQLIELDKDTIESLHIIEPAK